MGISRDKWHKRRKTGGRQNPIRKKRKFELGRPPSHTKLGQKRIHTVRSRGGNKKYRALRLDSGNFAWATQGQAKKTRIVDVKYNASNNELVRTKVLVKNSIVEIDATPFRTWFENYYLLKIGRQKKGQKGSQKDDDKIDQKKSKRVLKKVEARRSKVRVDPLIDEQFATGRLLACITSRPGQCGRADGYILEGKELEFYQRKLKAKKGK